MRIRSEEAITEVYSKTWEAGDLAPAWCGYRGGFARYLQSRVRGCAAWLWGGGKPPLVGDIFVGGQERMSGTRGRGWRECAIGLPRRFSRRCDVFCVTAIAASGRGS